MSKFILFSFLLYITRNPIIAILILLLILYVIDRRFIGLTPSLIKPIQRMRRISRLRDELQSNPHASSTKLDLARNLMERKKYSEALKLMQSLEAMMDESADLHMEIGLCHLQLGSLALGEQYMKKALKLNPRVGYGEPYLRLAEAYSASQPEKAIATLEEFRSLNSSSCEAYYRLGLMYKQLGQLEAAKQAFQETSVIYRSLPKYNKRKQRRWALLAKFKS